MAIDMESETDWNIYIVGGWTGSANCQVTRVTLPDDLCSLWSSSKIECRSHMGCSFCSTGDYTKCYSVDNPGCEGSDRISTNAGAACDADLVARRPCENFTSCMSCLAAWPLYPEEKPACRWCETCAAGIGKLIYSYFFRVVLHGVLLFLLLCIRLFFCPFCSISNKFSLTSTDLSRIF